jgi:hypothetical protein
MPGGHIGIMAGSGRVAACGHRSMHGLPIAQSDNVIINEEMKTMR